MVPSKQRLSAYALWVAAWISSAVGVGTDECSIVANYQVCSQQRQSCKDPDLMVDNNWECVCSGSSTGANGMAAPATCTWTGECTTSHFFCGTATCFDPDTTKTGDWTCLCVAPKTTVTPGSMTTAAVCSLDECLFKGNYDKCHDAGQKCTDVDTAVNKGGDWECSCISGTGTPVAGGPATCTQVGECVANVKTCTDAGQTCRDPDPMTNGDWVCECIAPETGTSQVMGLAKCEINECTSTCPTCVASACTDISATCVDPNLSSKSLSDWKCVIDECIANGATCTGGGQTCDDPNTAPTSLGDWTCSCPAPQAGKGTAALATCELDECVAGPDAGLCTRAGQTCTDPAKGPASTKDFVCTCIFPLGGMATAAKATCVGAGDCGVAANIDICEAAAQTCSANGAAGTGFKCVCAPPSTGTAGDGKAGNCQLDECTNTCATCADTGNGNGNACTTKMQTCKDPDPSLQSVSDWFCEVDECVAKGTACTAVGQTCTDPNVKGTSLNDWQCKCATGGGSKTGGPADCIEDECVANAATCVMQKCSDPDTSQTGDWTCSCLPPQSGSAKAGVATCTLDECLANSATCTAAGQVCRDPVKTAASTNDWTCDCVAPATGTPGAQAITTCTEVGECVANAATCKAASQNCNDPDTAAAGDWQCECIPPATGTAKQGGVAVCNLDECGKNGQTCTAAGQTCNDPDKQKAGDWICTCNAPQTGTGQQAAATCTFDECTTNKVVCTAVGQTCRDDNKGSLNDWACDCTAPTTGTQTAAAATCTLDECIGNGMTCTAKGQSCNDPNTATASTGDWTCNCVMPATGMAVAAAATCMEVGECTANSMTCTAAGQSCDDPNTMMAGDWTCKCVAPEVGTGTASVAQCSLDECIDNGSVCTKAMQTCNDPDQMVKGDWTCTCTLPLTGTAKAAAATCVQDECAANTCPAGQTCNDPDTSTMQLGDWTCACDAPAMGMATAGPATCVLDECGANAMTCTAQGQRCDDPVKTGASTNDWTCNCVAPATGAPGAQAIATCMEKGECVANSATCKAAQQSCEDPNDMAAGDWLCKCIAPQTGTGMQGVATCELDECVANAMTCPAGQSCNDPNKSPVSKDDWTCDCNAPSTGSAAMAAATCTLDECVTNAAVCTAKGQTCDDPDKTAATTGDWTCSCVAPATGTPATGAPATCTEVGECVMNAATCAAAGQSCDDPNTGVPNDWVCNCIAPKVGKETGGVATCELDECLAKAAQCPMGQTCQDVDKKVADSWECVCDAPQSGRAKATPATCELDECNNNKAICTTRGQLCEDPNKSAASKGDWVCKCIAPSVGPDGQQRAASCIEVGECTMNSATCTVAGQSCNDPDQAKANDWECKCIAPATGTGQQAPAVCETDECLDKAALCPSGQACVDSDKTAANSWECVCDAPTTGKGRMTPAICKLDECGTSAATCTAAGQTCTDPTTNPDRKGDWTCNCIAPSTGAPATAAATMCTEVGECVANAATCKAAGQSCDDPSTTTAGDWTCKCIAPAVGVGKLGPATCETDECVGNTDCPLGQTCKDDDKTAKDSWECVCTAPATGKATKGPATCVLDECVANAAVCTAAGQTCKDPAKTIASKGDWTCNCIPPATGAPGNAGVATCMQTGECVANIAMCTARGQSCSDPDPAAMGDWVCECISPQAGAPGAQAPASCNLDECVANAATCPTGQKCEDVDTKNTNTWECVCTVGVGKATGAPATCEVDECIANRAICDAAGQACKDTNTAPAATGDWSCSCIAPSTGTPVRGAVAMCSEVGDCIANVATCTNVQQHCKDPDVNVADDWICECVPPAVGVGQQGPASCDHDECLENAIMCQAGQHCQDDDKITKNSWECVCDPPSVGRSKISQATCEVDECWTNDATCTAVGQSCKDPNKNPTSLNDWTCNCVAPATGTPAVATATTCQEVGECIAKAVGVCHPGSMSCKDPDEKVADDWQCVCIPPATGIGNQAPAVCLLDECIEHAIMCPTGQTCVDDNKTKKNSWECVCDAPTTGRATISQATCEVDECKANGATCSAAGQGCEDRNKGPAAKGDWYCTCIAPAVGTPVQGATTTCTEVGECVANAATCKAAKQSCDDPDMAAMGDWVCRCIAPATGTGMQGVATCELDECIDNAATCPTGQTCVDADKTATGNWECTCTLPKSGTGAQAPAVCVLDECAANSAVCTAKGQECKDADNKIDGDWMCNCVAPATGAPAVAAATMCTEVGECVANAATCTAAGQSCDDPDLMAMGDWTCKCIAPATGTGAQGVAMCEVDECVANAATCPAGQACEDTDKAAANSWECVCNAPSTGRGAQKAATCATDECTANGATCTAAGQQCADPDTAVTGDWTCSCIAPATGAPATAAATMCTEVGECVANAATCKAAGQSCDDPDLMAMGDWTCKCIAPATGMAVQMGAATCGVDECVANAGRCPAGQDCVDADQTAMSNWECVCKAPTTGKASMAPATCEADECAANGATCSAAGQACNDPDKKVDNDWTCVCVAPATGTPATAAAAMCTEVGECVANAATCKAAGQSCNDPNTMAAGDWVCECITPAVGSGMQGAATCEVDECIPNAATCTTGQKCQDDDKARPDNWKCVCLAPLTGSAVAAAATCEMDECTTKKATCEAAGQACEDPVKTEASKGDWTCACIAPATGTPGVASAATCTEVGECVANAMQCFNSGQSCDDPDTMKAGDWVCKCIAPAVGTGVAAPAKCEVDECTGANAKVCTDAGQTCNDPDKGAKSLDNWECVCASPRVGNRVGAAAACELDECVDNAATCASAGQACVDPNKAETSTNDWTCNCIASATGMPGAQKAAMCTQVGECVANEAVCTAASQSCDDPGPTTDGDWVCKCIAPGTGTGMQAPAACQEDECVKHGAKCGAGQTCSDPDTKVAKNWICTCTAPQSGTGVAGPATCALDECTGNDICSNAGQNCVDGNTDPTSKMDWTCNCAGSATGAPVQGSPATCTETGECVANAKTCNAAKQACNDPDPMKDGDWECQCLSPLQGTNAGAAVAMCIVDECVTNGATCTGAKQNCVDGSTAIGSKDDWECRCIPPLSGSQLMGAVANCTLTTECDTNVVTCSNEGQICLDPDPLQPGDWRCSCQAPFNGSAEGKPAACELDECIKYKGTCENQGQTCFDPDVGLKSLDDWQCLCVAPAKGKATAGAATCVQFGECKDQAVLDICLNANQSCNDPDEMVMGDWFCECIAPKSGTKVPMQAATCALSECVKQGSVCTTLGQTCDDPDNSVADDWTCNCVFPAVGSQVGGVASCGINECGSKGQTCTDKGQICVDPDPNNKDDWSCICQGSGQGEAKGKAAACTWGAGECGMQFLLCQDNGQACLDPNENIDGDWMCTCVAPQPNGTAIGKKAECGVVIPPLPYALDECKEAANEQVCVAAAQECFDPKANSTSLGDWECVCQGSGTGKAVAAAATCAFTGVCAEEPKRKVCLDSKQSCTSLNDTHFECGCVSAFVGKATNGAATCRAAVPVPPGAGCSWTNEPNARGKCEEDPECEWAEHKNECAMRYCILRNPGCELDPICEREPDTKICTRTRCGQYVSPEECGGAKDCKWEANAGGTIPLAGLAYAAAPAYCVHSGAPDDNSTMLTWLIIICVMLCLCVAGICYLTSLLRKRLERKEGHRKKEEDMQDYLLQPERELTELTRVRNQTEELSLKLRQPTQDAPQLALVKGAAREPPRAVQDSEDEDEDDSNDGGPQETERTAALRPQLRQLKMKAAEQALQLKQREEAKVWERKKRQLEVEMDNEENRKETQRQLDRAKASHALQYGVAQRDAAKRSRERKREQELLLELEKAQSLMNQQRRRRADLGENRSELRGLDPHAGEGGDEYIADFDTDKDLEKLLHGAEPGHDTFSSADEDFPAGLGTAPIGGTPSKQRTNLGVRAHKSGMRHAKHDAQPVVLRAKAEEGGDEAMTASFHSLNSIHVDDPAPPSEVQLSSVRTRPRRGSLAQTTGRSGTRDARSQGDWDRTTFKDTERTGDAKPTVTDYNKHYQTMVDGMVEDKLTAFETRRELGTTGTEPGAKGGSPGVDESPNVYGRVLNSGALWNNLLEGVVRESDAAGGYSVAHASAPELPASPDQSLRRQKV